MSTSPVLIEEIPKHYTLPIVGGAGAVRFTDAVDIDGVALDGTGLINIWAQIIEIQSSNESAGVLFIGYRKAGQPATLDKTRAMFDLAIGQGGTIPRSETNRLRSNLVNLRYLWAKSAANCWLHIVIPNRGNVA